VTRWDFKNLDVSTEAELGSFRKLLSSLATLDAYLTHCGMYRWAVPKLHSLWSIEAVCAFRSFPLGNVLGWYAEERMIAKRDGINDLVVGLVGGSAVGLSIHF